MELHSKKMMKELKDLDNINDADLDTSEIPEVQGISGAAVGKYYHSEQSPSKDRELN